MKVCFVNKGCVSEFGGKSFQTDVISFGFNGFGTVKYKDELSGETNYCEDLTLLSKEYDCVVISGAITDSYGSKKRSAVIADRGKMLGISDMAHVVDGADYECGSGFRVYDTSRGKIGIIVADDIYFPEVPRVLTLCDSDIIFCIFGEVSDTLPQIMMRSASFANGVTIALSGDGYCMITDIRGKVALSSPQNIVRCNIKIEKDYHFIESRKRGLYREFTDSY